MVVGLATALGLAPRLAAQLIVPLVGAILLAALLGAPVFVAMGGIALALFFRDGTPVAAVPAEIYRLIASPTLPAIPLLTAAGYVLAEGEASLRLVRFFRALFGGLAEALKLAGELLHAAGTALGAAAVVSLRRRGDAD